MATRYAGQRPWDALLNGPTQLVHEGIAELAAPGANPLGWINSAQVTVVAGERAFGKFSTTSTHLYKDTQLFAAQFPAVCVFRFYSDDVTSNNMVTTLGDVSNPGTNSRFQIDFDSGNLRCLAAGSSVTSISTPVSTGQWYTGVYVARSSTDKFLALGGKAIGADTGSSPMPHAFTRIMVGDLASGSTPTGGGNYLPGYVSFCEWLPISVSDAQAVEWSRDYGQMFAPQSSRAPVAAGGAPDFPFTGSGGIAFAGAATAAYTAGYAATGSGGLSFNGNATTSHTGDYAVTATGGLTFAGSATCTFDTGYDITGSGGVQFGGAATVSSTADYAATGAGGLQFGGAATASSTAEYTATGAGGLAFGGAADAQLETGFSATGSGGINFGGAATVVGTADYLATGAGGLNLGGTAAVEFFSSAAPAQPASGGGGRQAAERRIRAMRQRAEAESSEQLIQAIIAMVVSGALDEMSIE